MDAKNVIWEMENCTHVGEKKIYDKDKSFIPGEFSKYTLLEKYYFFMIIKLRETFIVTL